MIHVLFFEHSGLSFFKFVLVAWSILNLFLFHIFRAQPAPEWGSAIAASVSVIPVAPVLSAMKSRVVNLHSAPTAPWNNASFVCVERCWEPMRPRLPRRLKRDLPTLPLSLSRQVPSLPVKLSAIPRWLTPPMCKLSMKWGRIRREKRRELKVVSLEVLLLVQIFVSFTQRIPVVSCSSIATRMPSTLIEKFVNYWIQFK